MHLFLLLLLLVACVLAFTLGLRGTVYEVSLARRNFGGVLISVELFIFVILGVFTFELFDLRSFLTVHVTESSVPHTSIVVLWSIFVLLVFLTLFSRVLFPKYLCVPMTRTTVAAGPGSERALLDSALLILIVLTLMVHLLGVRHAFIQSMFFGESLLAIRLTNRYDSGVPTVLMSYYSFLWALSSILLGYVFSRLSVGGRVLRLLILLYAVSIWGQKAPIVIALFLISLAALSQARRVSLFGLFYKGATAFVLVFGLLFWLFTVQYPHLDPMLFVEFVVNRLAVGQIQGVYEQFALQLQNPQYLWHSVPFASFFLQYEIYNKDLMMHTLGLNVRFTDIGVMNSLFIGEALAIGGYPLVFLSPVIVAFNYCLLSVSLILCLSVVPGVGLESGKRIVQLLVPSIAFFTADIAGLLMFKLNIMTLVFIAPVIGLVLIRAQIINGQAGRGRVPIGREARILDW
jgi:hypothetical protein